MRCDKCGSEDKITKLQTVNVDGGWLGQLRFDRYKCDVCGNVWVCKIVNENETSELKVVRSKTTKSRARRFKNEEK